MTLHLPDLPPFVFGLTDAEAKEVDILMEGRWSTPAQCEVCWGKGSFLWYAHESVEWSRKDPRPDPKEIEEYECPCVDQWLLHRHLLAHGIKLDYQTLSVHDFHSRQQQGVAFEYIYNIEVNIRYGMGMLLTGTYGTGKSMTSALVVKAAAWKNISAYYATFADMIEGYTQTRFSKEERENLKSKLKAVKLLVIDDVGNEFRMGYKQDIANEAKGLLDDILRARNAHNLCTFVTTNMDMDTISRSYGANVASLLGEYEAKDFVGEDFRKFSKKERTKAEIKLGLIRPVTFGVNGVL